VKWRTPFFGGVGRLVALHRVRRLHYRLPARREDTLNTNYLASPRVPGRWCTRRSTVITVAPRFHRGL